MDAKGGGMTLLWRSEKTGNIDFLQKDNMKIFFDAVNWNKYVQLLKKEVKLQLFIIYKKPNIGHKNFW